LIDMVGTACFAADCQRMADAYGERFLPSAWFLDRAVNNRLFYPA
jgi:3-hydroxyacyl-CoA dehydrogenase / enoyl-CoA hydratase / 3-hydroxybutyryl-CoA epimerase